MTNRASRRRVARSKGKKWLREGTCQPLECGAACCNQLDFYLPDAMFTPQYIEFMDAREIPRVKGEGQFAGGVAIVIPAPCPQLTRHDRPGQDPLPDKPWNWECKIYESRPQICADFPLNPDQLATLPECTYWFVEA